MSKHHRKKHSCSKCSRSSQHSSYSSYTCPSVPCYVPAPRLGACCHHGLCSIEEERFCLDSGGYWMGIGTKCWQVRCPEAPAGACCYGGGRCSILNQDHCDATGGLWQGPYTNCSACVPLPPNQYWPPGYDQYNHYFQPGPYYQ